MREARAGFTAAILDLRDPGRIADQSNTPRSIASPIAL